jgi:hypothetical protein
MKALFFLFVVSVLAVIALSVAPAAVASCEGQGNCEGIYNTNHGYNQNSYGDGQNTFAGCCNRGNSLAFGDGRN